MINHILWLFFSSEDLLLQQVFALLQIICDAVFFSMVDMYMYLVVFK